MLFAISSVARERRGSYFLWVVVCLYLLTEKE